MVDVSNLKATCNEVQEQIQILDTEISEALDMVHILIHSCDGGLECIMQSIASKLHKASDVIIMDCINDLMDLESGLQMYKEEHDDFGELPGLTDVEVYDEENNEVVNLGKPEKKRGRKKKSEQTIGEVFDNNYNALQDIFGEDALFVEGSNVKSK